MKRILVIALVAVIVSVLTDFSLHGGEGHFIWSNILGFFALFGLTGCVAIILVSKWLGHRWLQRPEDYYDRDEGNE